MSESIRQSIMNVVDRLMSKGVAESSFTGCTEDEIEYLETKYQCRLPIAYRIFLEVMGKSSGPLFDDVLIHYDSIEENIELADELVAEDGFRVPEDRFVFACRLGIVFVFFRHSDLSENPPIYSFLGDTGRVSAGSSSFTEMLERQADIAIEYLEDNEI